MTINLSAFQQQRRDTAANWTSQDPTLKAGEIGYETDTGYIKVGDGSTAWTSLAYIHGTKVSAYPLATVDIANDAITGDKLANDITIANDLTVTNNLTVNGTTTTIDTTTLTVEDKNIELGTVATPSDTTADGGGITLKGATDKTLTWVNSTDCWTFNQSLNLPAGSASAPALILNGDVNSGLFQSAADEISVATGGTQRVVVDSSGRVGINTSVPQYALQVNDTSPRIRLEETSSGASKRLEMWVDLSVANIGANQSAQQLAFQTTGSERMRIDSSGRLLVGTTAGAYKLVASGGVATTGIVASILNPVSGGNSKIHFSDNATYNWTAGTVGNAFAITPTEASTTAGTPALFIDSSGKVGIGTTTVDKNLHVKGSSGQSTAIKVESTATSTERSAIEFFNGSISRGRVSGSNNFDGLTLDSSTTESAAVIRFRTGGGSLSERMRIDSSGNVGIGTTSPDYNLVVKGSANVNANIFAVKDSDNTRMMSVEQDSNGNGRIFAFDTSGNADVLLHTNGNSYFNGGNVGIGTTIPGAKFDVQDSGSLVSRIYSTANEAQFSVICANSFTGKILFGDTNATRGKIQSETDDSISLYTGGTSTERARIDSSGRLLIGTSTARSNFYNSTISALLQTEGSATAGDPASRFVSQVYGRSNNDGPVHILAKHRSTSLGGTTIVANGDQIGRLSFQGSDGTQFCEGASVTAEVDGTPGANSMPGRLVFSTADGASSATERMRIDSSGSVNIGNLASTSTANKATTSYAFIATGTSTITSSVALESYANATSTRYHLAFSNANGVVGSISTNGSATAFNTSSDYRLKENVVDLDGAITRVKQLAPKRFNFIADDSRTVDGFLAHEAQVVVPEAVTGTHNEVDDDGNPVMQGIDQSKLVPLLTAALQEAIAKIETLEAKVAALEAE